MSRVKTPTVLQMEALECGAAALGMVLGYFGRFLPLEQLRIDCGVSRDGSKASNILRAARLHGLEAKGHKRELGDLGQVTFPVVLFWEFNHFVVLEGIVGHQYYLNDPAAGHRVLSREEFEKGFTGVVLEFAKGLEFQKGGERPSLTRTLFARSRRELSLTLLLTLLGFLIVSTFLSFPALVRLYVDDVLVKGLSGYLVPVVLAMAFSALLRAGMVGLREHLVARFSEKLSIASSSQFIWHILRLPIGFFGQRYLGDISGRAQTNVDISQACARQIADSVLGALLYAIFFVTMAVYDALLTFICFAAMVMSIVLIRFFADLQSGASQRVIGEKGRLLSAVVSGLYTIESIKANGSESDFFTRFSGLRARASNASVEALGQEALAGAGALLTTWVCIVVVLAIGSLRVLEGQMTLGMLIAFELLAVTLLTPLQSMSFLSQVLEQINFKQVRIDDVMRCELDPEWSKPDMGESSAPTHLSGHVSIRNLSYAYDRFGDKTIEDFSLELKPASRVALVGATGSGKSTIAKLVCGLYEPLSGEILFDNVDRKKLPREVLSAHIGYVEQDIYLLAGTLWDNLTLWDALVSEEAVYRAAQDAQIHDQIVDVLGGYDAYVDEGGRNLSGGEVQRLEIARALVNNPSLLVLDECMSALDPIVEKRIDDALRRRGCTCLFVAHRLSTIRDCDEIVVLDKGRIVQRGTHDELIQQEGQYRTLIESSS